MTRAVVETVTAVVVHDAVPETAPAGTVMELGPPHAGLEDVKLAVMPPLGAGDPRANVRVDAPPPVTVDGEKESEPSLAAVIVSVALAVLDPSDPLIDADVVAVTGEVEIEKVAVVLPLGTVTLPGTLAAVEADVRETEIPSVPALAEIVTVPVLVFPPATDAGETETLRRVCALAEPKTAAIRQVTEMKWRKAGNFMGSSLRRYRALSGLGKRGEFVMVARK